jgi:hypothetical protein
MKSSCKLVDDKGNASRVLVGAQLDGVSIWRLEITMRFAEITPEFYEWLREAVTPRMHKRGTVEIVIGWW